MEPNSPSPAGGPNPEVGPSVPSVESIQVDEASIETAPAPAAPEVDRSGGESANQNQGMVQQPVQVPVVDEPTTAQPVQDDNQAAVAKMDTPDLADDVDVIEKAWVDKAKQIVKETVDDPYRQNHNVSLLRADYMKKRYGKEIKVPEDKASKS